MADEVKAPDEVSDAGEAVSFAAPPKGGRPPSQKAVVTSTYYIAGGRKFARGATVAVSKDELERGVRLGALEPVK